MKGSEPSADGLGRDVTADTSLLLPVPPSPRPAAESRRHLVVCSLEAWDDIWRRNQFLVRELLRRDPTLHVLFVEPPLDVPHTIWRRRRPLTPGLRSVPGHRRLWALRPLKVLPRIAGPFADQHLASQVRRAATSLGFTRPTLWVNDVNYLRLAQETAWPCVYDVTDDWLAATSTTRGRRRVRRNEAALLRDADEVVVCSPGLAASRGGDRPVHLIPNAVDVQRFTRPRARPSDMPTAPTAVYVGTLHEDRLDVALCEELADRLPHLHVTLVGPDALSRSSSVGLKARPNIHLLGPRPHDDVPGYLQHADVVIVPHVVTPFTESLDPIKAYECMAVGTPTVATPLAGFRQRSDHFVVAERSRFVDAVAAVLTSSSPSLPKPAAVAGWEERARRFAAVLEGIDRPPARPAPPPAPPSVRLGPDAPVVHRAANALAVGGFRGSLHLWRFVERLVPLPRSAVVSVLGHPLPIDLTDVIGPYVYYGVYERWELEILTSVVRPGTTCIDVGANEGLFTAALRVAAGPDGQVIAVEPQPALAASLQRHFTGNDGAPVLVLAEAVGAADGTATLWLRPGQSGLATLRQDRHKEGPRVQVPVRRLDAIPAVAALAEIEALKIDVEGFEAEVLEGASRLLGTGRVRSALVEVSADRDRVAEAIAALGSRYSAFRVTQVRRGLRYRAALEPISPAGVAESEGLVNLFLCRDDVVALVEHFVPPPMRPPAGRGEVAGSDGSGRSLTKAGRRRVHSARTDVAAVLLACLDVASRPGPRTIALDPGTDLSDLASAAIHHGIAPAVHRVLGGEPALPDDVRAALKSAHQRQWQVHLRALADLAELSSLLDGLGVAWAAVKGPLLVEGSYERMEVRSYVDLDLVVARRSFPTVLRALESADARLFDRNWAMIRDQVRGELTLTLRHGTMLDLHWHVFNDRRLRRAFNVSMSDLLSRAVRVDVNGTSVSTLEHNDLLVYLAARAAVCGGYRLVWLKDLERIIAHFEIDWHEVVRRAHSMDLALPVATMLGRARRVVGATVPSEVLDELAPVFGWRGVIALTDHLSPPQRSFGRQLTARTIVATTRRNGATSLAELGRAAIADVLRPVMTDPSHPWRRTLLRRPLPEKSSANPLYLPGGDEADREAYLRLVAEGADP